MSGPFTRRAALKLLAVSAGVPVIGRGAERVTSPRTGANFKLGIASYSLRGLPLDAALVAVRRLGLSALSINRAHLSWEHETAGWERAADKFGPAGVAVRCCGVMTLKNDEAMVRGAFDFARKLGVHLIACSPEPAALPLVARCTEEFGIRAAIHNHGPEDKIYPSPHEAWAAVQPFGPGLGLCIDVGHSWRAGADPADCIRKYASRLLDVHLKDSNAAVGAEDVPVEMGRGKMDIPAILTALIESGYGGTAWFEYEKDAADPLPGLAESIGYVRGLMRGMGLDADALNRMIS
ncbi:MAG TPA: sugar phosphate isomerase/epimerase [Candidatus Didemnitutus sp.]|nr:sugar phosphate isomerase/epimerase [Candidatus Didemnitutus sp.]